MSIKSKIQALITAANNTTGESDATLTDAVQRLADGYGQGGGESYAPWTTSGDIEFSDTLVRTFSLPINCPCNTAQITISATKTGTVSGGVVTYDDVLTAHDTTNEIFGWIGRKYTNLPPLISVAGDGYSGTFSSQLNRYYANSLVYAKRNTGPTLVSLIGSSDTGANRTVKLDGGNLVVDAIYNSYLFCNSGLYKKFHYEVVAWNE